MAARKKQSGFTLVEILIVVVILGILASIVVPQFSNATDQSRATAVASIVRTVQSKVFENFATGGDYPTTIEDEWFVEGTTPINPLASSPESRIIINDTSAASDETHPSSKVVSSSGAFWYNPSNGSFRALVPAKATEAETLALYNEANSTDITSISATSN